MVNFARRKELGGETGGKGDTRRKDQEKEWLWALVL